MKTIERAILTATAITLLLLFLYPPFVCIDPESRGQVHGTLGHHAIWNTPTPEFAFRALYPNARELPNTERLAGFEARINRVRLTIYTLTVALIGSLALSMLRRFACRNKRTSKY